MVTNHEEEQTSQGHRRLTPVGLGIIIMGISIALVVILWLSIGHIGSSYSSNIMIKQQETLRPRYGLLPKRVITDPKILQMPPSLRPPEYKNCIPYSFC